MLAQQTLPPAPSTTRAQRTPLSISADGTKMAYASGKVAVLRSTDSSAAPVIVARKHTAAVTCAVLSPCGRKCASGDAAGHVSIWQTGGDMVEKLKVQPLNGPVKDISWTEDGERICIVGDSKPTSAVALNADTGTQIGSVSGHTKPASACAMRPTRPFRLVTGGQDTQVNFYEGPPFKFKHAVAAPAHKNTVTCAQYSPDLDVVATTSGQPKVQLCDGKTGEPAGEIATKHAMTVMALAWAPDGQAVCTVSTDKSARMTARDGTELWASTFGKDIPAMAQGVAFSKARAQFAVVLLSGDIAWLDAATGVVKETWRGHNEAVAAVAFTDAAGGSAISVAVDGRALHWGTTAASAGKLSASPAALAGVKFGTAARNAAVHPALAAAAPPAMEQHGAVAVATADGLLAMDAAAGAVVEGACTEAAIVAAVPLGTIGGTFLTATNSGLQLVVQGEKKGELFFAKGVEAIAKCEAVSAVAASADGTRVAVAVQRPTKAVLVFDVNGDALGYRTKFDDHHRDTIRALAVNQAGTMVASGDTGRNLFVWSAETGEVAVAGMDGFQPVSCVAFSPTKPQIATGGVDDHVLLWDLDQPQPGKGRQAAEAQKVHTGGVTAIAFAASGNALVTGGHDGVVRTFTLE